MFFWLRKDQTWQPCTVLRLYYDVEPDEPLHEDLCRLACEDANLDLCYVRRTPSSGDISRIFAMNWRFFPTLDPQVVICFSEKVQAWWLCSQNSPICDLCLLV